MFNNADGDEEFFYIAVRGSRMPSFKHALEEGGFFPEDYGFILEHGKGEASELLKEKMTLQYRCDHKNAMRLINKHRKSNDIKKLETKR